MSTDPGTLDDVRDTLRTRLAKVEEAQGRLKRERSQLLRALRALEPDKD